MKKPTPEQLQIMADQRCAALIRRWLAGKKLAEDDLAFVSTHGQIPIEILRAGPSSPGAKEAVSKLQTTRKKVKYPKPLSYYAELFGQTDRTIKRWINRGKQLPHPTRKGEPDLPPLDQPWKMPGWWRRCMDHEVPDYLLGFAEDGSNPDPIGKAGGGRSDNGGAGDTGPRDYSQVKSLDIAENVEALRHTHAINKHLLDEALQADEPNDTLINLRRKNFEGSFDLLRKAEISLIEIQKQRGKLIDEESVRAELAQLLESLRLMRETMPHRIIIALEQILPRRLQRVSRALEKVLTPAIEKARADEENIFRNLASFNSSAAVRDELVN